MKRQKLKNSNIFSFNFSESSLDGQDMTWLPSDAGVSSNMSVSSRLHQINLNYVENMNRLVKRCTIHMY